MKKEVVWPKQSLEPTQLQSWATSSVRLGRSDGEQGGQEPSLWEEARKTATRQPREGRHSLPEGKCRQKP